MVIKDAPYICGKHSAVELQFVLRGGAGWCASCCLYVQSANHPEPLREDAPSHERF